MADPEGKYPILVRRFPGKNGSMLIICQDCETEGELNPDDLNQQELYECPAGCGGRATWKYVEGDACPNCNRLGFFADAWKGACSRACQLQLEYAGELRMRDKAREATRMSPPPRVL